MKSILFAMALMLSGLGVAEAKNCKKGCACGNACIACNKTCRVAQPVRSPQPTRPKAVPKKSKSKPLIGDPASKLLFSFGCEGYKAAAANPQGPRFLSVEPALAQGYRWASQCNPTPDSK